MSSEKAYPGYRSLSSVAQALLPRAERMHMEGMTWRQIARDLRVSYTALHIWRKLRQEKEKNPYPDPGFPETRRPGPRQARQARGPSQCRKPNEATNLAQQRGTDEEVIL